MKIVNFRPDNPEHIELMGKAIKDVTFNDFEDREFILKTAGYSEETLKEWFDIIGIKYDDIKIEGHNMLYTCGGNALYLTDLSHAEKYLLYIIAMQKCNKTLIVNGIREFMGSRICKVLDSVAGDYDKLTVIEYH